MTNNDARLIVVTQQRDLYTGLVAGLRKRGHGGHSHCIPRLSDVEQGLVKNKTCVLVLDMDVHPGPNTHEYLRQLVQNYMLLVIITATSQSSVTGVLRPPIKELATKPRVTSPLSMESFCKNIADKIKAYVTAQPVVNHLDVHKTVGASEKIIAIASSTGGTEALDMIFRRFPVDIPPVLVVQHMASGFTKLFADRLNKI